jgi:acetyl-CoA decarbonylase/synthase complex subunit gamma
VTERVIKRTTGKEMLSPLDVYRLLPKTICRQCGEDNCLNFAAKLVNREVTLEQCPPLLTREHEEAYRQLKELLKPPIKEIIVGTGEKSVKIGGKLVMHRHEFACFNPTVIAIDVTDEMPDESLRERIGKVESFSFEYIGQTLKLNMIALRSTSNDPEKFATTIKKVTENTTLPLMLCSLKPNILKAGLTVVPNSRLILYAATKENWTEMAELALTHNCPLAVFAPNDISLLTTLTKTLMESGVEDLVLDPGTFYGDGLADSLNNLTMIRRAACKRNDSLLGFPLIGVPLVAWTEKGETAEEIRKWREACLASMLIVHYADIVVLHSLDGWSLLPNLILRQNIYTDPRKPVAVEPGLKTFGNPDENSPVMFTTNFALTYYTVASDMESAKLNAYLLVVDTGGIAVDSSVAGRKLTAQKVAQTIRKSGVEDRVKHRILIIPGKSARLKSEIEQVSGWHVLVGPKDSSDIPKFLEAVKLQDSKR